MESASENPTELSQAYERYCREMDTENRLTNQRVNWLLTSESILFAAVGISNNHIDNQVLLMIAFVGIGSSLAIGLSILGALRSFKGYYNKLNDDICSDMHEQRLHYPQLNRRPCNMLLGDTSPMVLPALFIIAWVFVLIVKFVKLC